MHRKRKNWKETKRLQGYHLQWKKHEGFGRYPSPILQGYDQTQSFEDAPKISSFKTATKHVKVSICSYLQE